MLITLKYQLSPENLPFDLGKSQFLSGINMQSWRLTSYSWMSEPPWSGNGFDPTLTTTSSQQWIFHLQFHISAGQHSSSSCSHPPHSYRLKYPPPRPSDSARSSNIKQILEPGIAFNTSAAERYRWAWHYFTNWKLELGTVLLWDIWIVMPAFIRYVYMYVCIPCRHNSSFTAVQSSNQCYLYQGQKNNKKKNQEKVP